MSAAKSSGKKRLSEPQASKMGTLKRVAIEDDLDLDLSSYLSRKVEQVAEEAGSLKESLDMYLSRNQRRTQEARERAELLGRVNGESSHVLTIFDKKAQAMQSARNSFRMLEESYAIGVAILSQYAGQRNRLKVSVLRQLLFMDACKHIYM